MAGSQGGLEAQARELHRYQIFEAHAEPAFEGLCELARSISGCAAAVVVFPGWSGAWSRSAVAGLAADWTDDLPLALRGEAAGATIVIADLSADPDFCGDVRVAGAPSFRAMVSMPLVVRGGLAVGALTVFDVVPRTFEPATIANLERVATAVVDQLKLRRARIERRATQDVQARKNAEIAAQRSEIGKQRRLLEQTSRLARVGGWEYDVAAQKMTWSQEIYRILEVDPRRRASRMLDELTYESEDAREHVAALVADALRSGTSFEAEIPIVTSVGRKRWVRCLCEAEMARGKVTRLLGIIQDITVQRATEEEVNFIATHDMITGLMNRSVFQERLDRALIAGQGRAASRIGLFLADIDHFKGVNDTLGHQAGDSLLAEVGQRLMRAIGRRGLVARLGGDEFAILIPEFRTDDDLVALAAEIRRELIEPISYGDDSIPVTLSIGIASATAGETADQLLKDADIALYEAKGAGRNRSMVFDCLMREEIELRQSMLRSIRHAIEADELVLYYQPKISLITGALAGFEALLRWRRPDGFVASPSFFAVTLEDPQLGQAIGDLVIRRAAMQAARWARMGFAFGHIAVNASSTQFRRGHFAEELLAVLSACRVQPKAFMVEVTENVLLSRQTGNVQATLVELAEAGVSVALDDFGTGYASLTHLKEFPVDLLKIDRSFVANLAEQRESRAIVRGITALAHDLGVEVIAEGVETAEQREILRKFGVEYGQGYLFARPMPAEQVELTFLADAAARKA